MRTVGGARLPRAAGALVLAVAILMTVLLALLLLPLVALAAAFALVKAAIDRAKRGHAWRDGRRNVRVIPHRAVD